MSAFTTPVDLRMLDDFKWELLTPFEYHVGSYPSGDIIKIPAGSITDLASVPRILWSIFPPHGRWAKAAIVHDYLYDKAIGSKDYADCVFYEAMQTLGVPTIRRKIMYWSVRLFGKGNYK